MARGSWEETSEAVTKAFDEYGTRWNEEFKRRGLPTVPTKKDLMKVAKTGC